MMKLMCVGFFPGLSCRCLRVEGKGGEGVHC